MHQGYFLEQGSMHGGGESIFPGLVMMVGGVIFISIVAVLVWYLASHNSRSTATSDPLAIAKARYAKGEITKTEYSELKKDILAD